MEKQCVVCHLRESLFRCIQCHKPVCDECAFKTTEGAFCGRDCATSYRDYMTAKRESEAKERARKLRKLKMTLLVGGLLAAGIAIGALVATGVLTFGR